VGPASGETCVAQAFTPEGVEPRTKVGFNNTDTNDQGAFDAANNRFLAPADDTGPFGATLLDKVNASTTARWAARPGAATRRHAHRSRPAAAAAFSTEAPAPKPLTESRAMTGGGAGADERGSRLAGGLSP
jgi:hypothetical protein